MSNNHRAAVILPEHQVLQGEALAGGCEKLSYRHSGAKHRYSSRILKQIPARLNHWPLRRMGSGPYLS